jgi:hypothetical protein
MKNRLFIFVARGTTVSIFSFGAFLPFFAWREDIHSFGISEMIQCLLGAMLAGIGYALYRALQEDTKIHRKETPKMRYNMKYEHTSFNIEERPSF